MGNARQNIAWNSAAELDEDLNRVAENLTDAIARTEKAADWLTARRDQISDDPAALQRLDFVVAGLRDSVKHLLAASTAVGPFVGMDHKLGITNLGLDEPTSA